MSNSTIRGTEYTGNNKERATRPLSVQEQARAMRRECLMDHRPKPEGTPR